MYHCWLGQSDKYYGMRKIWALLIIFIALSTSCALAECNDYNNCTSCQPCLDEGEEILATEHLFGEKNAQNDQVIITNLRNIICKGNALQIVFSCKFWSEEAKAGERVNFEVPEAIYTQEGTLILPACSKVVATVTKIEKQRFPNKNARVHLAFDCVVLPDGTALPISAIPLTKDGSLKEGAWHTTGKLVASTLGLGIVGAGAGTGFAFIPTPAKLGVGFAVGIPVGCTVGLITGLLTPGLKYHAKAGEAIQIIFCENASICKFDDTPCNCQ